MTSLDTTPYVTHATLARFAESRVNLPKSEVDEHRGQVQRLRDHLDRVIASHDHYKLIKTVHSGSVAKGTALRSVSDMDVAAYLDASQVPAGDEHKLLTALATILRSAYGANKSPEDFEEQAHSVKVHFHGSGLDIDVAPIVYAGLPDDRGDLITKDGVKVETSVRLHREFISARKRLYGRNYAQVTRFLKFWARQQRRERGDDFRCKSFLLELIVAHLAGNGLELGDYPNALETVFAWIVRTNLGERVWFNDYYTENDLPVTDNKPIRVYDPANRDRLVDAGADALDAITAARYGTTKGYSVECWQQVFGPTFRGD
jgi:tRNA nucleotidyltransferase (CCA-adding enzyme)